MELKGRLFKILGHNISLQEIKIHVMENVCNEIAAIFYRKQIFQVMGFIK